MHASHEAATRPLGWWAGAALAFCLLATLNTGGYRFGVADQAFYLPAIQRHLQPESFPRDRLIIDDQDRLNVFTAVIASGVRSTTIPVETWMAATYTAALLLLFGAVVALSHALGASPWASVAAAAALTLRHRVGITGVNTLEGYGHPRLLAFAVGLWAVHACLRGRTWRAVALVGAAFVVHPTTALWFGVWVGVAALVADRSARLWLAVVATAGTAAALWAVTTGPLAAQMVVMDTEWRGVVGAKDYLFPHLWPVSAWLMAAGYVAIVVAGFAWRRARGRTVGRETALVIGLGTLLLIFLLTLPASAAAVALAVQFQVPRILWMFDLVGTLYVVLILADGTAGTPAPAGATRARAVAALLCVAALGRGVYVMGIEHPERPLVRWSLPADPWQDALRWLEKTPADTLVLADPGHAWKFGTSVRVGAGRDVLLEEVKDTAMSMYSRRVAMHVLERIRATEDFGALTPERARALADKYTIAYLVDERPLALPIVYQNTRFRVYRLRGY